jgi:DNA-binding IclR family transcriptional regulator
MSAKPAHEEDAGYRPVKSASRTLDVLEAMATAPRTLPELTRELGIPKSSLHGLLRTLTERGWAQSTAGGTQFRLGLRAVQMAFAYVDADEAVVRLSPFLDQLAESTGETVQHARLDGDNIVYLAKRDSPHPVRLISTVGSRLPAHATALGKALLSARDDATIRATLHLPLRALTPSTITEWQALRAELARTRERGYSIDDSEAADGLRCFAVTVPGPQPPTDAVSVSVPTYRLDPDREADLVRRLLAVREQLPGNHATRQAMRTPSQTRGDPHRPE